MRCGARGKRGRSALNIRAVELPPNTLLVLKREIAMCNAWNHPPGCTCGWGGDGYSGSGGNGGNYRIVSPVRTAWQYRDDDYCRSTTCPKCGATVYFVRHNGGSVWFDDLGHPWPKHACFDDDRYGFSLRKYLNKAPKEKSEIFGIIIETEATNPGQNGRIIIRCSDGSIINEIFNAEIDLTKVLGSIVIIKHNNNGTITVVFL